MRLLAAAIGLVLVALLASPAALAAADIRIDLSTQTMTVTSASGETHVWPISSARAGYVTPRGVYHPQRLARMHYSKKYDLAPMPHSIFFRGGYAIHGTNEARSLGRPASHGCVRLARGNAAMLYAMVQREGAVITITGSPPRSTMVASHRGKSHIRVAESRRKRPAVAEPEPDAGPALGYAPAPQAPSFFPDWLFR